MTCPICQRRPADKYKWCRDCISRAARGAARYFLGLTDKQPMSNVVSMCLDDPYHLGDLIKREANKWQRRFKNRLRVA